MRSKRGSRLNLDHQVSLYNWTQEQQVSHGDQWRPVWVQSQPQGWQIKVVKVRRILKSAPTEVVGIGTYALLGDWGRGQADDYDYDAGDGEEDDGKVQIMDVSNDCRPVVRLATRGRLVGKLENHSNDPHHQSNHQTPKRTLWNGGNTNSSEDQHPITGERE